MKRPRNKTPENGPAPPSPEAVERARKFLDETDWDQYWNELSARMQSDSAYHDFSFLLGRTREN